MIGHGSAVNPKTAPTGDTASRIATTRAPSEVCDQRRVRPTGPRRGCGADEEDDENLRRHRFDEPGGAEKVGPRAEALTEKGQAGFVVRLRAVAIGRKIAPCDGETAIAILQALIVERR